MKWRGCFCLAAWLVVVLRCAADINNESPRGWPPVRFLPDDRILVLAPHPDDEVIGCGGLIQRARSTGLPVRVVFLTYGDNNQWSFAVYRRHPVVVPSAVRRMGELRRSEAVQAGAVLGLDERDLAFLGYPDFGTLRLWYHHWGAEAAMRSMLTASSKVPYADAFRPGALYKGEEVVRDIKSIIRDFRPTKIFVSHPADHNPDHQALYLFTTVALWDLEGETRPTVLPYLVHFRNWPEPKGLNSDRSAAPPPALAKACSWTTLPLQPDEIARKHAALERHKSQVSYNGKYLLSFVRCTELFGDFPVIVAAPSATTNSVEMESEIVTEQTTAEDDPFLSDEERALFVGIKRRVLHLAEDALIIGIRCSRPLAETTLLSIYAFGYRHDTAFEAMPKVHVQVTTLSHQVFDQSRLLPPRAISVTRTPREILVRIPFDLLGKPERLLTSARTRVAELPLDWVAWRVISLAPALPKKSADPNDPGPQVSKS